MTLTQFEREVKKFPNVISFTVGKTIKNGKWQTLDIFVHFTSGLCVMELGDNCLEAILLKLKEKQ